MRPFFVFGVYLAFVLGVFYSMLVVWFQDFLGAANGPPLSPCVYVFVVCVVAAMMIFSAFIIVALFFCRRSLRPRYRDSFKIVPTFLQSCRFIFAVSLNTYGMV